MSVRGNYSSKNVSLKNSLQTLAKTIFIPIMAVFSKNVHIPY